MTFLLKIMKRKKPAALRLALLCLLVGSPAPAHALEADRYDPYDPGSGQLHVRGPDGSPGAPCPLDHTAFEVDLAAVARAAGFPVTGTVRDEAGLEAVLPEIRGADGPVFYDVRVRAEELPLVLPPKDGVLLKERFRAALLEADADQ